MPQGSPPCGPLSKLTAFPGAKAKLLCAKAPLLSPSFLFPLISASFILMLQAGVVLSPNIHYICRSIKAKEKNPEQKIKSKR